MKKILACTLLIIVTLNITACKSTKRTDSDSSLRSTDINESEEIIVIDNILDESSRSDNGTGGAQKANQKSSDAQTSVPLESHNESKTNPQSDTAIKKYSPDEWKKHPEDYKLVALTFDDGTSYSKVDAADPLVKIVKLLKHYKGNATFFLTGNTDEHNEVLKYLVENDFEIGNHSLNHKSADTLNKSELENEILTYKTHLENSLNVKVKYYRSPGFTQSDEMWEILNQNKIPNIDCMISVADFSGSGKDAIYVQSTIMSNIRDGAIIGMHSTNKDNITPIALNNIMGKLYDEGYRFCTVSELFELRGVKYSEIPIGKRITGVSKGGVIFTKN